MSRTVIHLFTCELVTCFELNLECVLHPEVVFADIKIQELTTLCAVAALLPFNWQKSVNLFAIV